MSCKDGLSKGQKQYAAKSFQLCPTLCDPKDISPPGSPIPGILQARTLEWVAISFFNAWKWKVKVKSLSRVRLLLTPWTAAYQAPPSMGFSRQVYWSGVPSPSPKVNWLVLLITHAKSLLPCKICHHRGSRRSEGYGNHLRILAVTLYYSCYYSNTFFSFHHFSSITCE